MSEVDRLFHPVTGSLAAIFLMLFAAGLVGHANRYHNQSDHHSSYSETGAPLGAFVPDYIPENETVEARKERREEADLAAQNRMAVAAENAFYIGIASVVLLGATVLFAGLAWKAAADGAAAAWKSEETSRDIGQKQSMAYVHALEASLETKTAKLKTLLDPKGSDRFSIEVQNLGETAAKRVRVLYGYDVTDTLAIHQIPPMPYRQGVMRNIAPKDIQSFYFGWDLHDRWEKLEKSIDHDNPQIFRIFGEVQYDTVFNKRYRSQFMFWAAPVQFADDQTIPLFDNPRLMLSTFEEVEEHKEG